MQRKFQRDLPFSWHAAVEEAELVINWLERVRPEASGYYIRFRDTDKKDVFFEVEGNAVMDDFDIVNTVGIKGIYKLEIISLNGFVTILDQVKEAELYIRIKCHYEDILKNCLGKSVEEQQDHLCLKDIRGVKIALGSEYIQDSENYIRSLPLSPKKNNMVELIDHILYGKEKGNLEYGYHSKDKYSVEMHEYAIVLAKKIGYIPPYKLNNL